MTLVLRNVSKTFSGQAALKSVGLDVRFGEVHALVGQNGSGKSTLIKLLAGYHFPDPGSEASLGGTSFELGDAAAARRLGLRFVHQDLALVMSLNVLENMMLGREYPRGPVGNIRWRRAREQVTRQLQQLGVDVDPMTPIADLPPAERTAVAIGRALADAGTDERLLVVLDEPTATLPRDDVGRLLEAIAQLRQQGHGVVLVSHHLDEVLEVADVVTVLRDAVVVDTVPRAEVDHSRLTEMIVGHAVDDLPPSHRVDEDDILRGDHALTVRGLQGGRLKHLDLDLLPGEIVGYAGITGSGRETLASLLVGRLPRAGSVAVAGQLVRAHSPQHAIEAGLGSIPGERARFGVFANLGVRQNMTIAELRRHRRWFRLSLTSERREVQGWIDRLGIRAPGIDAPITSLSGGNQQKVLVARALRLTPKVLVLDDPTQGIDIGARAQVHDVIARAAAEGMAVVLTSTDSDELARLADRVVVMVAGRQVRTLTKDVDLTADAINHAQLELTTS